MNKVFFAVLFAALFVSCSDPSVDPQSIKSLESQFNDLSQSVKEMFSDTEVSVEELKKLRQIEYSVLKIAADSAHDDIANTLSLQGRERWDCFHVEKAKEADKEFFLFFCKRPVGTPLRYIPSSIIGR